MDIQIIEDEGKGKDFDRVQKGDVVILPAFGASVQEMQASPVMATNPRHALLSSVSGAVGASVNSGRPQTVSDAVGASVNSGRPHTSTVSIAPGDCQAEICFQPRVRSDIQVLHSREGCWHAWDCGERPRIVVRVLVCRR